MTWFIYLVAAEMFGLQSVHFGSINGPILFIDYLLAIYWLLTALINLVALKLGN